MEVAGGGRGLGQEFLCCCGLGIWLFDAVVTDTLWLRWTDWGWVWGCALEGREGLGMQLGLGFCCSSSGTGYLKMFCCIGQICSLVLQ